MRLKQSMERRMNPRKPLRLAATLRYTGEGGGRSVSVVTRDLSYEGAFVEGTGLTELKGRIVHLELQGGAHGAIAVDALVLRAGPGGLGLMFAYYSSQVFEELDALLEPEEHKRRCAAVARRTGTGG